MASLANFKFKPLYILSQCNQKLPIFSAFSPFPFPPLQQALNQETQKVQTLANQRYKRSAEETEINPASPKIIRYSPPMSDAFLQEQLRLWHGTTDKGKYEKMFLECIEQLVASADSIPARDILFEIWIAVGKFENASICLNDLFRLAAERGLSLKGREVLLKRVTILLLLGLYYQAAFELIQSSFLYPQSIEPILQYMNFRLTKKPEILAEIEKAVEKDPGNPFLHISHCLLLLCFNCSPEDSRKALDLIRFPIKNVLLG